MYELLGICLVLAALLTINAFASLLAAAAWRLLERPTRNLSARARAEILFVIRISPPALAVISVVAFLVPSFLVYEPYATTEVVSKKLGVLAVVSAGGVGFALWRRLGSWWATRTLLRKWLATAEQIRLPRVSIPAFRIRHPFPIIAVVGTLRPRLFIARHVLQTLSEEELIAAIAHECGHVAARDNLKRMLMRACRDLLATVPCGRSIDRAWAENAEAAADEHAADNGSAVALNLASALIEIARMVPAGARAALPTGAFILGHETDGVKARVNRLIALAGVSRRQSSTRFMSLAARAALLILLAGLMIALTNTPALASLHIAMERIVRILA